MTNAIEFYEDRLSHTDYLLRKSHKNLYFKVVEQIKSILKSHKNLHFKVVEQIKSILKSHKNLRLKVMQQIKQELEYAHKNLFFKLKKQLNFTLQRTQEPDSQSEQKPDTVWTRERSGELNSNTT